MGLASRSPGAATLALGARISQLTLVPPASPACSTRRMPRLARAGTIHHQLRVRACAQVRPSISLVRISRPTRTHRPTRRAWRRSLATALRRSLPDRTAGEPRSATRCPAPSMVPIRDDAPRSRKRAKCVIRTASARRVIVGRPTGVRGANRARERRGQGYTE